MTVWRWGTSNVPRSSAFMPAISKYFGSFQQYKGSVDGQPGTIAIPAPNNDIPHDRFQVSADHRSSDAPPFWFPQVWYQHSLPGLPFPGGGNDAGVRIYSDNQLPVPSIDPTRGTHRYGGGQVHPVYQDPYRRAQTQRTVQLSYG
jgi:hypothetical protein